MTTQRFYLLASAVLSLLLASATAAHASTSVSHVNGPDASFFFCNSTVCGNVFVLTNQGPGGANPLTIFYDFEENGIDYFGNGLAVPHSVFNETGQSATLNVDIDTFSNGCFAFDPTVTCTPLSNGNITASWTVNGLASGSSDGSNTHTFPGISVKTSGHFVFQAAEAQGTMFGVNFDTQNGVFGREDMVTLTFTTAQ